MKSILPISLATLAAMATSACVVVPARPAPAPAPVYYEAPVTPPPRVVYVAPAYPMPAPGYTWGFHARFGWGWHHPHRGWHRGWR